MKHFHIRWSNPPVEIINWESFSTQEEAQAAANELKRPNENYTIVQFDGYCPRCSEALRVKKEMR